MRGTALYFRYYLVCRRGMSKSFSAPISASLRRNRNGRTTLAGWRVKSRAFNRALSIMLVSGLRLLFAVLTRMPSL